MRIKGIKSLKLGKDKDKEQEKPAEAAATVPEAPEANEPEDLTDLIGGPLDETEDEDDSQPHPHGPLEELTVEPGADLEVDPLPELGGVPEESGEGVKLVELTPADALPAEKAAEAAPAEAAAEAKPTSLENDSLSGLFSNDEEEENPLAALINSLPDVTVHELMEDLGEINEIISEQHQ